MPENTTGLPRLHAHGTKAKASPADVRRNNRSLIWGLLFPGNQYSRAELGRLTGLSRVAISDVVSGMLTEGLIHESGREIRTTGKGKRGTLLSVDTTRLRIISIDLSQAHLVSGAVTNLLGTTLSHAEIAVNSSSAIDIETIAGLITRLLDTTDASHVIGIGIAATGVVHDGIIRRSTELGWSNMDLCTPLEKRFCVPVIVTNDVICSMMTERFFGQAGPNLLFVKVDRGVGSATLINDVPIIGENYAGGEIGHIVIDPAGPACPCGKNGCLEVVLSATALRERIRTSPESEREKIIADAGRHLTSALAVSIGLLDMGDVCIWGPPDIVNDVFFEAAQACIDRTTVSTFHKHTTIRRCQCGPDITLRGATVAVAQAAVSA